MQLYGQQNAKVNVDQNPRAQILWHHRDAGIAEA